MGEAKKSAGVLATTTAGGAAAGVGVKAALGGMGLAVGGTAFAVPIIAIGAGVGLILGGTYLLGRARRKS